MANWEIITYSRNQPVWSYPLTHFRTPVSRGTPIDLSFDITLDGIDTINFNAPAYTKLGSLTIPHLRDFILYRDGVSIMGGIITETQYGPDDEFTHISGREWFSHLEKTRYPQDLPNYASNFDTSVWSAKELCSMAQDLIYYGCYGRPLNMYSLNYSAVGYPGPKFAGLDVTFAASPPPSSGVTVNYAIEWDDTESIWSKVQGLSETYPGFDVVCSPDRVVTFYTPRKGTTKAITLNAASNIRNVSITNSGIRSSIVHGTSSKDGLRFAAQGEHSGTALLYRQMYEFVDYGENIDQATLQNLVTHRDLANVHNVEVITCEIIPEKLDYWNNLSVGDTVKVDIRTDHGNLLGNYRIVNVSVSVDTDGSEHITLTLDNSQNI